MSTEADKVAGTDAFYDYELIPDTAAAGWDIIQIRPGRAKLYFNKDTYTTPMALTLSSVTGNTQVKVYKGAYSVQITAAAIALASSLYLF